VSEATGVAFVVSRAAKALFADCRRGPVLPIVSVGIGPSISPLTALDLSSGMDAGRDDPGIAVTRPTLPSRRPVVS
jgi:hypothetical protein